MDDETADERLIKADDTAHEAMHDMTRAIGVRSWYKEFKSCLIEALKKLEASHLLDAPSREDYADEYGEDNADADVDYAKAVDEWKCKYVRDIAAITEETRVAYFPLDEHDEREDRTYSMADFRWAEDELEDELRPRPKSDDELRPTCKFPGCGAIAVNARGLCKACNTRKNVRSMMTEEDRLRNDKQNESRKRSRNA